jgi:hypothetical protein
VPVGERHGPHSVFAAPPRRVAPARPLWSERAVGG